MKTYDRTFFRSRLGRVAKLCVVAMLAMNVVAIHAQLYPEHGMETSGRAEVM